MNSKNSCTDSAISCNSFYAANEFWLLKKFLRHSISGNRFLCNYIIYAEAATVGMPMLLYYKILATYMKHSSIMFLMLLLLLL